MKKSYLIFFSIPVFVSNTLASDDKDWKVKINFGARAGINYSNFISTPANSSNPWSFLLGWNAGGYFNIKWNDKLAIQPELLITLKGAKVSLGQGVYIYSRRYYGEIPLQLKINISSHFAIYGGPYAGYLVATSTNQYDYFPNFNANPQITESRWDIGATLSLGYELKKGFNTGIRVSRGFNNTNEPQFSSKEYNEVGTIYLGWTFIKFKN